MQYFQTIDVNQAVERMLDRANEQPLRIEEVELSSSYGRLLAKNIAADTVLPAFRRSTMDGYAVRASDCMGASASVPAMLRLAGEVPMGEPALIPVQKGQAVYVPTGAMIPEGADAVVMVEETKTLGDLCLVYRSPAAGEHIVFPGEDVEKGEILLKKGTRIGPETAGMLAALSVFSVPVFAEPKVAILSTGNEIIGQDEALTPGKVRDINTYTIEAQMHALGCRIVSKQRMKDDKEALIRAVREAAEQADFVYLSGGSSVGARDYTKDAITALSGELLFHGLNIKPGKPTLAGFANGCWILGLPGHPVSALLVLRSVLFPYWEGRYGEKLPRVTVQARLSENMASSPGRLTMQSVTLKKQDDEWIATPFYGPSAFISQLVRADGVITVPRETEGLYAGDIVEVERLI
ncbi:MAG: molybdopterin molybdotransferase MoeA [Tissierellia bacterium]|nr:molybdopterin molybdotransferase MoeA [Tissierellia bacterium]